MSMSRVVPLHCAVQNYHWGKLGSSSEVASLIKNVCPHFQIDDAQHYAELWIGTHPSGPSYMMTADKKVGIPLQQHLKDNPHLVGNKIYEAFGWDLPFLMKVLSVKTALSIQAHPNKALAEKLHESKPDLYKDPNHKPEMALALTPFEALCGFRMFNEICNFLKVVPELTNLIGHENANVMLNAMNKDGTDEQKEALKIGFTAAMMASKSNLTVQLNSLVERITKLENEGKTTEDVLGPLLLKIHKDFPGDIGCFGIYFLNYLHMKAGEALYLGANEPHAYIYGDCIEIMACSDNVVRAGLTPKFIDVQTLVNMLTYRCSTADSQLFAGSRAGQDEHTIVYDPPVPDFTLAKIHVPASKVAGYVVPALEGASILLTVQGAAEGRAAHSEAPITIRRGTSLFLADAEALVLGPLPSAETGEDLIMFRGYCRL